MKKLTGLLLLSILVLSLTGCGGSSSDRSPGNGDEFLPISADILPGTWTCTRYALNIGMDNEMMARMQGDLVFSDNEVVYMGQTYSYSIENDRVTVTHNGQEILKPLAWDGESLVMLGDDARVYYQKQ